MCNRCLIKETKKLKCMSFIKNTENQYKGNKGHRLASCGYEAFSTVRLHILVTTLSWRDWEHSRIRGRCFNLWASREAQEVAEPGFQPETSEGINSLHSAILNFSVARSFTESEMHMHFGPLDASSLRRTRLQGEVSQKEKNKYSILTRICGT